MTRRRSLLLTTVSTVVARAAPGRSYRAAIIGHTGRGDYGHDWDTAWAGIPGVQVVAVADPDEPGRATAMKRSGAPKGYADYRQMLDREKPNLVAVCPRGLDERLPMVTACAEAGAHILMEKPFARSLPEADAMVQAVEKHGVKVQVGLFGDN